MIYIVGLDKGIWEITIYVDSIKVSSKVITDIRMDKGMDQKQTN